MVAEELERIKIETEQEKAEIQVQYRIHTFKCTVPSWKILKKVPLTKLLIPVIYIDLYHTRSTQSNSSPENEYTVIYMVKCSKYSLVSPVYRTQG